MRELYLLIVMSQRFTPSVAQWVNVLSNKPADPSPIPVPTERWKERSVVNAANRLRRKIKLKAKSRDKRKKKRKKEGRKRKRLKEKEGNKKGRQRKNIRKYYVA